jgi:tetraacyldisaccharide 4'-kinase
MILLRILFYPISLLYQFIFYLNRIIKTPHRLPVTLTISIGNLSVGGTGKTPFTLHLAKLIPQIQSDIRITILTRGYGGAWSKSGGEVEINSLPENTGDEPLLLKRNLPYVDVLVGRNRILSFYRKFPPAEPFDKKHIVLLDDGFQHFSIERDIDIVLIDGQKLLGNGNTIPIGRLREKFASISRADVVVFTKIKPGLSNLKLQQLETKIKKSYPNCKIFHAIEKKTEFKLIQENGEMVSKDLNFLNGKKVFAFTGLGNPEPFFNSIKELVGGTIETRSYPDHFSYPNSALQKLFLRPEDYLVCTEKDAVKFSIEKMKLFQGRLVYLRIESEIIETSAWYEFWNSALV